ncbi:hypothetical protein HK097_003747 [Rhizophlyctis rosea]|uniref:SF3 helicase domain-containing protein n=1 Tax=Rhizophlyctis rosea TaxID=64517 RepID=A0AAD5S419_9FUNG|nr:hypothetical protein HK097_003747 [Rhizophlyctis rosea]
MGNPAATATEGVSAPTNADENNLRYPNAADRDYPMLKLEFVSDKGLADLINSPMLLDEHRAQFKALMKRRVGKNTYKTEYNYGKKAAKVMGRLYGNGACLQGIKSRSEPHRQFLCGSEYHDIDQVNSAPTLFLHLLAKNNLVSPELEKYVADRATCLSRWNMKKRDFLATLNRQQPPAGPADVKAIHSVIYEKLYPILRPQYPEIVKKVKASREIEKKANPTSSFLSTVLQTLENTTLLSMHDFFEEQGWCPDVLMFDGLQVRRQSPEGNMPEEVLRRCETYVKERTGVTIHLAEKPMEVPQSFLDQYGLTLPAVDEAVPVVGDKPFDVVRDTMLAAAREMKVCKDRDGNLYRFANGLPYACTMWMSEAKAGESQKPVSIMEWMQDVLMDLPAASANPRVMDDVCKVLTQNRFTGFDFVKKDRHYFGFSNGILHLPTGKFTPAEEIKDEFCAHRYFDQPYTGATDTPLMDSLLQYQFPDADARMVGVIRFLYMMIGRTVLVRDNWQVMLYLQGESMTGKSVVVKICQHILSHFGTIADGFDIKHGLSDLFDKDLVTWDDLSKQIASIFPGDVFQSCVTNGPVPINRKHAQPFTCPRWYPPIVGAGNRPLPYDDNRGQTSRKTISFEFTRVLQRGDPNLLQKIMDSEVPNLICKGLGYYLEDLKDHGDQIIWEWCPEYFREQRDEMRENQNPWYRFIRNCERLIYNGEKATLLDDVRKAYKDFYGRDLSKNEAPASTFSQINADWVIEVVPYCKFCKERHRVDCCDRYSRTAKTTLTWIKCIELLPPPPKDDDEEDV